MSLSLARIRQGIYTWIQKQTVGVLEDGHIIERTQSEPLPWRPCVTFKIIDGPRRVGFQDNLQYDANAKHFVVGGQRELTVSIQVFGNRQITDKPRAYQIAIDLNSSLSKPSVLEDLRRHGIAIQVQGDPTNITALEETEYEERAQFDILCGVAQNVLDDPGAIEHANIDGTVGSKDVPVSV